MKNDLGEVFFDGRTINLELASKEQLENILAELKKIEVNSKEKIEQCFRR